MDRTSNHGKIDQDKCADITLPTVAALLARDNMLKWRLCNQLDSCQFMRSEHILCVLLSVLKFSTWQAKLCKQKSRSSNAFCTALVYTKLSFILIYFRTLTPSEGKAHIYKYRYVYAINYVR